MSTHEHFRKTSLSKRELAKVYSVFSTEMQATIAKNLPGSASDDELLTYVQKRVSKKIERTFEMAKYALMVDGIDLAAHDTPVKELLSIKPREIVEPFDAALNQELRALIQEVEKQTTEVTRLRRDLPQQARSIYEQLVTMTDEEVTRVVKGTETESDSEDTQHKIGSSSNENSNGKQSAQSSPENQKLDENSATSSSARNGTSTEIGGDVDTYVTSEVAEILNKEPAVLQSEAIKERLSAAIGELESLKREIPDANADLKNFNKAQAKLLQMHKRQKLEPHIYD